LQVHEIVTLCGLKGNLRLIKDKIESVAKTGFENAYVSTVEIRYEGSQYKGKIRCNESQCSKNFD